MVGSGFTDQEQYHCVSSEASHAFSVISDVNVDPVDLWTVNKKPEDSLRYALPVLCCFYLKTYETRKFCFSLKCG